MWEPLCKESWHSSRRNALRRLCSRDWSHAYGELTIPFQLSIAFLRKGPLCLLTDAPSIPPIRSRKASSGQPHLHHPDPAGPYRSLQKDQPVIVAIERKGRGGKTVSIVTGVASPPAGKAALLKQLKRQLGTGGTIKADTLEIQGDRRDEIVAILIELGFKAKKSGG